jgi:hypothetical protein
MHFEPDTRQGLDAGGVVEISRWWSEAKPPEPAPTKDSAPDGAAEIAGDIPAPLPGRRRFPTIVPVVLAHFVRFTTG